MDKEYIDLNWRGHTVSVVEMDHLVLHHDHDYDLHLIQFHSPRRVAFADNLHQHTNHCAGCSSKQGGLG